VGEFQDFGRPSNPGPFTPVIPDDVDLFIGNEPAQPWHGPSQADHTPSDQVFFAPPKVASQRIPDDWDMSEFAPPAGGRSPQPHRPADAAFAHPAQPEAAPRMPAAAAAGPNFGGASAGDRAAVGAFLAAIGLKDAALGDNEKIRVMQLAGETFATMAKGLAEILAARASIKQEFRIERTTIGATRNNPLKFSASMEEAIRVMLLGRTPGFLPAKEAIDEALDDIKSHQLAVLAGMQMALATVIARFDPDKLENRLDQRSLLEGILPTTRKARYWELFKSLYKDIATELEEDFQKAFGAEFARAYRKRIGRP
jgi:type VI secretion system FHA domain protein